jgi:hypothetical protein
MARRPPPGGMVGRGMAETRKKGGRKRSGGSKADSRKPVRGTAPSAADIDKLEKFEASEEAKQHEPSGVDAMGQDKRRPVVGHAYGPSRKTQFVFFAAVAIVLVVVVGGWLALVSAFDTPPEKFPDKAPWSQQAADSELTAQQQATPVTPLSPCGEPGNEYPIPAQSPCAAPSEANDYQGAGTGASVGQ